MVPRADIVAVEQSVTLSEVARLMGGAAHSRMPIYRSTLDDVIGMVHIKDVIAHLNKCADVPFSQLAPAVLFIAPLSRALALPRDVRMTRPPLALVFSDYGVPDWLI